MNDLRTQGINFCWMIALGNLKKILQEAVLDRILTGSALQNKNFVDNNHLKKKNFCPNLQDHVHLLFFTNISFAANLLLTLWKLILTRSELLETIEFFSLKKNFGLEN